MLVTQELGGRDCQSSHTGEHQVLLRILVSQKTKAMMVPEGQQPRLPSDLHLHMHTHTHTCVCAHTNTCRLSHTATLKHTHTHSHTCTHSYIHTHLYTHTHAYMHTYSHTQTHIHIHTHTHTHVLSYTHKHTDTQVRAHSHTHIHSHTRPYARSLSHHHSLTHIPFCKKKKRRVSKASKQWGWDSNRGCACGVGGYPAIGLKAKRKEFSYRASWITGRELVGHELP